MCVDVLCNILGARFYVLQEADIGVGVEPGHLPWGQRVWPDDVDIVVYVVGLDEVVREVYGVWFF